MGSDVEERSASSFRGIDEPAAVRLFSVEPSMACKFGEKRLADRARSQQLFCTPQLWISSSVISDAENASTLFRGMHHVSRFRLVHRHPLLPQHLLARS